MSRIEIEKIRVLEIWEYSKLPTLSLNVVWIEVFGCFRVYLGSPLNLEHNCSMKTYLIVIFILENIEKLASLVITLSLRPSSLLMLQCDSLA